MIAYNQHQYIIHFHCIAEINCNDNCIHHFIPISEMTLNVSIHGSNCNKLLTHNDCFQLTLMHNSFSLHCRN